MENESKFRYRMSSEDKNPGTAATFLIAAGVAGYNAFGSIVLGGIPCCFPSLNFSTIVTPKTACGIIFINSLVGLWRSAIPLLEEQVEKVYEVTSYVQDKFVLPIVVSSTLYRAGYMPQIAYLNALIPVLPFIAKLMEKEDIIDELEDYIVGTELLILASISALEEDYYGLGAAISYASYHFLAKHEKLSCIEIPKTAKMNIFMACFAAFIQKGGVFIRSPSLSKKSWFSLLEKKESCTANCPMKTIKEDSKAI